MEKKEHNNDNNDQENDNTSRTQETNEISTEAPTTSNIPTISNNLTSNSRKRVNLYFIIDLLTTSFNFYFEIIQYLKSNSNLNSTMSRNMEQ